MYCKKTTFFRVRRAHLFSQACAKLEITISKLCLQHLCIFLFQVEKLQNENIKLSMIEKRGKKFVVMSLGKSKGDDANI